MAKKLTDAEFRARMAAPVDVDVYADKWGEEAREVAESCRFLEKAARLYGRRRVLAALRTGLEEPEASIWAEYWKRWRAREDRHIIPWAVLSEPYQAPDQVAFNIALAPRVAGGAA